MASDREGYFLIDFKTINLEQHTDVFASAAISCEVLVGDVFWPDGQLSLGWIFKLFRIGWFLTVINDGQ